MIKENRKFLEAFTPKDASVNKVTLQTSVQGIHPKDKPAPHEKDAFIDMPPLSVPVLHMPLQSRISNRKFLLACVIVATCLLVVVFTAGIASAEWANISNFDERNEALSMAHVFGTDWMGRDMFARTIAGLSTSILIGLLAAGISSLLALVLASVAAFGGRVADAVVTWLVDLAMGIPHIVLLMLISYALGRGTTGVLVAVAITHWPNLTRILRAEMLQLKQSLYVRQAKKFGQRAHVIALRHMLPHVFPQYLVGLILLFPHAIMHEASLTFLGFGLSPDTAAIGSILSESMSYIGAGMWWLALFPGLALIVVVLLFDIAGSSLRTLIDPYRCQE